MRLLNLCVYMNLIAIGAAWAESVQSSSSPQGNVKILADNMECDQATNKCVATGNAVAQKLNTPDNQVISAETLIAYFAKSAPDQPSRLVRLEAIGDVMVTTGDTIIRAPRGEYDVDKDYAQLFEDVHVTNKENHVHGHYGEVFMKTGLYKIVSDSDQVEALLFTKESAPKS